MGIRRHFLPGGRRDLRIRIFFRHLWRCVNTFEDFYRSTRTLQSHQRRFRPQHRTIIMGSSDNFCLRWNDFESNISTSFRELRDDSEFFDVTLCCDNGTDIVPAHKVILAACSPLFRKILSRQKNQQNPFLYLKGIHLKEMKAVLNFMYHGEVNVAQDSLNNFLAVAEELAVKGLTTDSKPAGTDTPAKKAVVSQKQKRSLPPGSSSSTPQAAKKPKPSQSNTPSEDIEIEPHLEDVDIKSIKAEPEPSGSGSGGPGGSHAVMVEADLGDESYGASGAGDDDNGGSGAAADGKDVEHEEVKFVMSKFGNALLVHKAGYMYYKTHGSKITDKIYWICCDRKKFKCFGRATTEGFYIVNKASKHNHAATQKKTKNI